MSITNKQDRQKYGVSQLNWPITGILKTKRDIRKVKFKKAALLCALYRELLIIDLLSVVPEIS